ncbi:MAG: Ig-like domain-containing protein, partial [Woeseiaceae bacterium]
MRFRSFTLAAALLPVMSTGQAQDAFQFTYPEPNSEIALNTYQTVRVQWLRDSDPVFNGTVALRTDLGVIEDEVTRTGPNGVATFAIRSTTAGIATLHATTPDLPVPGAAELVVRFSGTVKSDQPFGDLAVQRSLENQLPLWILTDRIGFLARDGVSIEDVATIAADEGLTQLTPLSDRIFVLKVDYITAGDPEQFLRGLARGLEERHSEIFRAGMVAQIVGTRQWLVVPDQIIVRFMSGLSEQDIKILVSPAGPIAFEEAALDPSRYVITLGVAGDGALQSASRLSSMAGQVVYAEPNYVIPIDLRGDPKTDAGYGYQWHHENAGTYATEDADI